MLRPALHLVASLAVALWLGGLIALFAFVQALFAADRPTAVRAAPVLFGAFVTYQLAVGLVALLAAGFSWALDHRPRWFAVNGLLAVAGTGAWAAGYLGQEMERLRAAGETAGFGRLHGASMAVYLAVALAVLIAAVLLFTDRREAASSRRTTRAPAPASASRAGPARRATAT